MEMEQLTMSEASALILNKCFAEWETFVFVDGHQLSLSKARIRVATLSPSSEEISPLN